MSPIQRWHQRRKTRAQAVITRNLENAQKMGKKSGLEGLFDQYQTSRGLNFEWGVTLPFHDVDDNGKNTIWDFQLDFAHPNPDWPNPNKWPKSYDQNIEISGTHFHGKLSKERWKNNMKISNGFKKVVIVPTEMCRKRWWYQLDVDIPKALASPDPIVYIDETLST